MPNIWYAIIIASGPRDVTSLVPRPSERTAYLAHPHAEFKQTNLYFPGYIKKVYRDIAVRDSLKVVHEREKAAADSLRKVAIKADSLAAPHDTLDVAPPPADSLVTAPVDTLSTAPADTLSAPKKEPTAAELRAMEREKKRAERAAAREARWAEQDRRDAERKAAREQRKLERERARKLKALRKLEKRAQRDRAIFEKYLKRYKK